MSDRSGDLNPYGARVMGFVGQDGGLIADETAERYEIFGLLINVGEEAGVKVTQRVLVFAFGPEMTDPDTGENLGKFEIVKGEGRVESVQAKMSVIRSARTRMVNVKRPATATSIFAGLSPEYSQVKEDAPFKRPQKGDFVRFI